MPDPPSGEELLVSISFGYGDEAAPVNRVRAERAPLESTAAFHD
ncbi:hypothetical protein ABZ916_24990 [Streptomyces sp. NPDC046853]